MIQVVFWSSLYLIVYIYLGYPLCVFMWGRFKDKSVKKQDWEPYVTILIAAYNEEGHIGPTIENKLSLDYPPDKLEVVVISDESNDKTDEIVSAYKNRVKLIRQQPRAGKTAALNLAVPETKGEILVFSDANSIYAEDALRKIVRNFKDPNVGYVTGKMIYTSPDGSLIGDGCSTYMKYENLIRRWETRIGSIVGVDGGIDAVRRPLYKRMSPDQLPDFVLPLHVVSQGYRVVFEPDALLRESSLKRPADEYKMRVRVSLRAMWALYDMRHLLSFRKERCFAWQLWSHKVLRYLCFIFLISALVSNFMIVFNGLTYTLLLFLQIGCYTIALIKPAQEKRVISNRLFKLIHYFVLINMAAAHAFVRFAAGKKQVLWTPRKG
jgi:cellulose synthase/poly-beta-1,6-N-acetylglucosamine synthase-like glycosyltransferase